MSERSDYLIELLNGNRCVESAGQIRVGVRSRAQRDQPGDLVASLGDDQRLAFLDTSQVLAQILPQLPHADLRSHCATYSSTPSHRWARLRNHSSRLPTKLASNVARPNRRAGLHLSRYDSGVSGERLPGGVAHELPADLREGLSGSVVAIDVWMDITPLARNEFICWVEDARQQKTRERRIRRTREELEEGMRRPCCWPGCKHRDRTGSV